MTFSLFYSDDNKKNIFNNGGNNEHWFKQESIPIGCIPLAFLIPEGVSLQRPWTETPLKGTLDRNRDSQKELGTSGQIGSDVIKRPPSP